MALPTLVRSWQFQNNVFVDGGSPGGLLDEHRRLWWNVKNMLTTFATNPWKCVASANGAEVRRYGTEALGVPGPAYDTWGLTYDATKMHKCNSGGYTSFDNYATNSFKRSWIVLRNTQLGATYDLCLDMYINFSDNAVGTFRFGKMYISRSYNLSTGTVSARPTATLGEFELRNGNQDNYGCVFGGNRDWQVYAWRLHAQMSSDGLGTRLFIFGDSRLVGFWGFDRVLGADASFTDPVWACVRGKYDLIGDAANTSWLHDTSTHQGDIMSGVNLSVNYQLSTEGVGTSTIGEQWGGYPNEISGKYPMTPIGVVCMTTGKRGRLGYLADLWYGQVVTGIDGMTYPADDTRQFASLGSLVVPWDGINPVYIN
jgi:hypothetical protein